MIIALSMTMTALYMYISQILYLYTIFNKIYIQYLYAEHVINFGYNQTNYLQICNLHIAAALLTNAKVHGESSKGKMITFSTEDIMNIQLGVICAAMV